MIGPRRAAARFVRGAGGSEGQAIFEFAILIPLFLLILVAIFEFGFVFNHNLTLEYATREGARTGAALANGEGNPTVCASIDGQIVAAAQRVLTAPGSAVDLSQVSSISIWRATGTGATDTSVGVYTWTNTGPGTGPLVDGARLSFSPPTPLPSSWLPCNRIVTGTTPDSIGVSLTYSYTMQTPLAAMLQFVGGQGAASLAMTDRTVMALNPN